MFLSAQQIAQSREHTLNNLFGLSSAFLETSQRFAELLATAGREAIAHGSKQLSSFGHGQLDSLTHFPAALWLENSHRQGRMLDASWQILGDAHQALIQHAEAQVRVFDQMALAGIKRAERNSPWEAEIALGALRVSLEAAEHTLHEISEAAVAGIEPSGQDAHQINDRLPPPKTPTPRRASSRKKPTTPAAD